MLPNLNVSDLIEQGSFASCDVWFSFPLAMRMLSAMFLLGTVAMSAQTHWWERISLRGYTQIRYAEVQDVSASAPWTSGGFSIRRGRLILSGFATDNVFLYIQPDFAATMGSSLNVMQLRDAYFDVFLDSLRTMRLRIGQSKVPFGYENMQSSSLRLPMERAEVLNTASVPGERDIGVFAMWAPAAAREIYARLTRNGQKGSGDYGCISIGLYNGQGINRPKLNHTPYASARATYPLAIGDAVVEPAVQAFVGRFTPTVSSTVESGSNVRDERYSVSLAVSPSPLGVLAEYAWGHAPRYQPPSNGGGGYVRAGRIEGGFITMYAKTNIAGYAVVPFVRWQSLHGGIKSQTNAPMTDLVQSEAGIEWHISSALELTVEYIDSDRHILDTAGTSHQQLRSVWLQLQVNY